MSAASLTNIEIERKYLLSGEPKLPSTTQFYEYTHGFLPGVSIKERFTYKIDGRHPYVRNVKVGSGVKRYEFTEEVPEDFFMKVWPLTKEKRVHARRAKLPATELEKRLNWGWPGEGNKFVWEMTQFLDRHLWLVEIELPFDTIGTPSNPMVFPDWLKPFVVGEVTEDPGYEAFNLGMREQR